MFFLCGVRCGVVVSVLDFRSEGRWFEAQSLPSCCEMVCEMGTGDTLLGVTLRWTSIPSRGD